MPVNSEICSIDSNIECKNVDAKLALDFDLNILDMNILIVCGELNSFFYSLHCLYYSIKKSIESFLIRRMIKNSFVVFVQ